MHLEWSRRLLLLNGFHDDGLDVDASENDSSGSCCGLLKYYLDYKSFNASVI